MSRQLWCLSCLVAVNASCFSEDATATDLCVPEGSISSGSTCVLGGDHCRCGDDLVCSDNLLPGECQSGSGGRVHCVPLVGALPEQSSCLAGNETNFTDLCPPQSYDGNGTAMCVNGSQCSCKDGYVCSDTLRPGECPEGSGGQVSCVVDYSYTGPTDPTDVMANYAAQQGLVSLTALTLLAGSMLFSEGPLLL